MQQPQLRAVSLRHHVRFEAAHGLLRFPFQRGEDAVDGGRRRARRDEVPQAPGLLHVAPGACQLCELLVPLVLEADLLVLRAPQGARLREQARRTAAGGVVARGAVAFLAQPLDELPLFRFELPDVARDRGGRTLRAGHHPFVLLVRVHKFLLELLVGIEEIRIRHRVLGRHVEGHEILRQIGPFLESGILGQHPMKHRVQRGLVGVPEALDPPAALLLAAGDERTLVHPQEVQHAIDRVLSRREPNVRLDAAVQRCQRVVQDLEVLVGGLLVEVDRPDIEVERCLLQAPDDELQVHGVVVRARLPRRIHDAPQRDF